VRDSTKLPVIMFIHGESYEWNSGSAYDGSVLSSYGSVVVVTINYRLGILGKMPPVHLLGTPLGAHLSRPVIPVFPSPARPFFPAFPHPAKGEQLDPISCTQQSLDKRASSRGAPTRLRE
ncbi:hypothetical protein HPB47_011950, partial [Ixodes persulcatus]